MKKLIPALAFLAALAGPAFAQQEAMFTQFMQQQLAFNPAYAGNSPMPEFVAVHRSQWAGLDGAPTAQALSYSTDMLNQKVGVAGQLTRFQVGITTQISGNLDYAYHIPWMQGNISFGLQASMRSFSQNWNDPRLIATQPIGSDGAVPTEPKSKLVPNFGAGIYYAEDKYFAGIAVPRLLENNVDFAEKGIVLTREARTFYAMFGINFDPNDDLRITPQVLLKYVAHAPFDADFNCMAEFKKRFLVGLNYRTGSGVTAAAGESVDVLAGIWVSPKLYLGVSYDASLTELRKYNSGSFEAVVTLRPGASEFGQTKRFTSPRNF